MYPADRQVLLALAKITTTTTRRGQPEKTTQPVWCVPFPFKREKERERESARCWWDDAHLLASLIESIVVAKIRSR